MGINSRLIQIQKSSDPQIQIIKGGGSTLNYRINPGNKHQLNIFRLLKALLQQCQEKSQEKIKQAKRWECSQISSQRHLLGEKVLLL